MTEREKTLLEEVCAASGCTEAQVRQVIGMTLAALHKVARCHEQSATAAVRESMRAFGAQACYHLSGLLEESRTHADPDRSWWEISARYAPAAWARFGPVVDSWREERSEARERLDAAGRRGRPERRGRGRGRVAGEQLAFEDWEE
jgi:hypothetical protein